MAALTNDPSSPLHDVQLAKSESTADNAAMGTFQTARNNAVSCHMGEITSVSSFGKALSCAASCVHTVIEIGSGSGLGSTACLVGGLKDDARLYAVEAAAERARACCANYAHDSRVRVLHGVVSTDALMTRGQVMDHALYPTIEEHYIQCYAKEAADYASAVNVVDRLPRRCDMLVLDGGEFSTWGDWLALRGMQPTWIALDDVNVIKTSAIAARLTASLGWHRVFHTDERNGSSIFRKLQTS